jgi:hypothetical protein
MELRMRKLGLGLFIASIALMIVSVAILGVLAGVLYHVHLEMESVRRTVNAAVSLFAVAALIGFAGAGLVTVSDLRNKPPKRR